MMDSNHSLIFFWLYITYVSSFLRCLLPFFLLLTCKQQHWVYSSDRHFDVGHIV